MLLTEAERDLQLHAGEERGQGGRGGLGGGGELTQTAEVREEEKTSPEKSYMRFYQMFHSIKLYIMTNLHCKIHLKFKTVFLIRASNA